MMKRRQFIRYGAMASAAPFMFGGQWMQATEASFDLDAYTANRPGRKLVLVQLNGGADGLNMVIPISEYDNLYKARPKILVDQSQILKLSNETGLHPSMPELAALYSNGSLQIIQGVGYPNPNLSHFRSKDILLSGSDSKTMISSGWIGRMFNTQYPDYPSGYPNSKNPHPFALTIGSVSSPVCQAELANFSPVISGLSQVYSSDNESAGYPNTPYGNELKFIVQVMEQTESYLKVIKEAATKGKNLSPLYVAAGQNTLSDQLKMVANLINGGLQTQVYIVSLGGWDTHSLQVQSETEKTRGTMPTLMSKLSKAIAAFTDDLRLMGKSNEVIGLVYTEFGRRIMANDSLGTDHGTTWPAFVFGPVVPGITGKNAAIPLTVTKNDNLPLTNDFRSIYAALYMQWFGMESSQSQSLIYGSFPEIRLVSPSVGVPSLSENHEVVLEVFPNPATEKVNIRFIPAGHQAVCRLQDLSGRLLWQKQADVKPEIINTLEIPLSRVSPGIYNLSISVNGKIFNKRFIKH